MENNKEAENETPQEVLSFGMQDKALLQLVSLANHNVSTGVTLLLDGRVIVGDLMSGYDYCNQTAESIRSGGGNSGQELREYMATFFDELAKSYKTDSENEIPLNYLHLKYVGTMLSDGEISPIKGGLFRLSIEKISGFSMGRPTY